MAYLAVLITLLVFTIFWQKNEAGDLVFNRKKHEIINDLVLDFAGEGIIALNLDAKIISVNLAGCRILGKVKHELLNRNIVDILSYNILDFDIIQYQLSNPDAYSTDPDSRSYREFEYERPDKTTISIEFIMRTIHRDETLLGSVLVFRDITGRKLTEEKLEVAAKAFENSSEGIMVTDVYTNITNVNPAFTAITGYQPDEILGKTPRILKSGIHSNDFYEEMWKEISRHNYWEGEIWNQRKDGTIYPERLLINAIRNRKGAVTNYVGIFNDITARKRTEEHLKYSANHDNLTGLYNREFFSNRIQQEIMNSSKADIKFALLFLDLDGFKEINDKYGHKAGDQLLINVSERLLNSVRDDDSVARIGGDEFLVIFPDARNRDATKRFAQRIIESIATPFTLEKGTVNIGISIGISIYPDDTTSGEELVKQADAAMYYIKNNGKNSFCCYSDLKQKNN